MGTQNINQLFEVEAVNPEATTNHCRTCIHRERWQCGGTTIQYCGVRKSNRTDNGKLKIKAKNPACASYKKE
jgi:hypothetical protein